MMSIYSSRENISFVSSTFLYVNRFLLVAYTKFIRDTSIVRINRSYMLNLFVSLLQKHNQPPEDNSYLSPIFFSSFSFFFLLFFFFYNASCDVDKSRFIIQDICLPVYTIFHLCVLKI